MFTKNELLNAIDDLEKSPMTYQDAEKLATFYTLYDHLYTDNRPVMRDETVREVIIDEYGDTDFLRIIAGLDASYVWPLMDELMATIKALQPRLYDATLQRLRG